MLNGRKKPKYLVLKGPKFFLVHFGPRNTLYPHVFTFYFIFMSNLAQKFIFSVKKRQIFLKAAPSAPNFGRFAPKIVPQNPKLLGAESGVLAGLGGGCPQCPPPYFGAPGGGSSHFSGEGGGAEADF